MPATTPSPTLTNTKHSWRKIQGLLYQKAANFGKRDEQKLLKSLSKAPESWSAYEVTFTLDLNERAGAARVTDMGKLAQVSNVDTVEATINAFHSNARWAVSDMSHFADEGKTNQIIADMEMRASQRMDAMIEQDSDYFWGDSTAVLATTDSDVANSTSASLVVTKGFNQSSYTNVRSISQLFRKGDVIAALASGSDVLIDANAFGTVGTVVPSTGTVPVTWQSTVSAYTTNGIRLVKANNLERTTVTGGTDLNQGYSGIFDIVASTSLHGVSGSTYSAWNPALTDSNAGKFTFLEYWTGKDAIKNATGYMADTMLIAQGVARDLKQTERAGLRYEDSGSMDIDGDVQAKGVKMWSMRNNPPGMVVMFAKEVLHNWEILPFQSDKRYTDLLPMQDDAAALGRVDKFANLVCRSRGAFAYWSNKTEA